MAIWAIFCGCAGIVLGLTGKVFYAGEEGNTPIPTWLGKACFIGIGILFWAYVSGLILFAGAQYSVKQLGAGK